MDAELVVLRILHIVAGLLWAGAAVFIAVIMEPVLSGAGPDTMKAVGPKLGPRIFAFMLATGILTIVMGLILIARTPGRRYSDLFSTGWGWAIGLGLIAALIAYVIGATGGLTMRRAMIIGRQIKGPPPPETLQQLQALRNRYRNYSRAAAALTVIAVGAMASARYV